MTTVSTEKPAQTIMSLLKIALITGVISAVINLILFFVGSAVLGTIEVAMAPGEPFVAMPFFAVIFASLIPTLVAGIGLWIFRRFIPMGNQIFIGLAIIFTLFSLYPPITQSPTIAVGILLSIMHLVVGGMIAGYMTTRS